jgi:hypothetical protein
MKYLMDQDESYMDELKKSKEGREDKVSEVMESQKVHKNLRVTLNQKLSILAQITSEKQVEGLTEAKADTVRKFELFLQTSMKEKKIPLSHFQELSTLVQEVVTRIPLSALLTGDMDICKNIKFKCFRGESISIKYLLVHSGWSAGCWRRSTVTTRRSKIVIAT